MKKLLALGMAALMIAALAACGSKDGASGGSADASSAGSSAASSDGEEKTSAASEETTAATEAASSKSTAVMIPGVLYQLNLREGEAPVIRGVSLSGNRLGSSGDAATDVQVNGLPASEDNIRFIFALNEWISIDLDTDVMSGLTAYVAPHQDSEEGYAEGFAAALSDDVPRAELNAPGEDSSEWGSLYVNPDSWQPGDYDLVIASDLKPVARVLLKLVNEDLLPEGFSDDELIKLMGDEIAAAKAKEASQSN